MEMVRTVKMAASVKRPITLFRYGVYLDSCVCGNDVGIKCSGGRGVVGRGTVASRLVWWGLEMDKKGSRTGFVLYKRL